MGKRAEEAALIAYPVCMGEYSDNCKEYDTNESDRLTYQEGYEKAEKETLDSTEKVEIETADSSDSKKAKKKKIKKILKYVFIILVLIFLGRYFYRNREDYAKLDVKINWWVFSADR